MPRETVALFCVPLIASALVVATSCGSALAEAKLDPSITPLSGKEDIALFRGNTVRNDDSDYRYYTYHSVDGLALREVANLQTDKLLPDSATISSYGLDKSDPNKICSTDRYKRTGCDRFGRSGSIYRIIGDDGKLYGHITIEPGDPKGLRTEVPKAVAATDASVRAKQPRKLTLNQWLAVQMRQEPTSKDMIEDDGFRYYCVHYTFLTGGSIDDYYSKGRDNCNPGYHEIYTDKDPESLH